MKITELFITDQETFDALRNIDEIQLRCSVCHKNYKRLKRNILRRYNTFNTYPMFCSDKCRASTQSKEIEVTCLTCDTSFYKKNSQVKKTDKHFCSNSCRATYFNINKSTGFNRSKIEFYLEEKLKEDFKNLNILFSNRTVIGKELDIYIPDLNLAFEIQGIFHYQPIFGQEKLEQTVRSDKQKLELCKEKGINLYQIDISSQQKFTTEDSEKYYKTIKNIILKIL